MPKRRCLGCGQLIAHGTRCQPCRASRDRRYKTPVYKANRVAVIGEAGGACQCPGCGICDGNCTKPGTTTDHIVPLDRGGDDRLSNLRAVCRHCNSSKRNR